MTHPSRGFDFSRGVKASGLWETRKGGGVSQLGTGRDWGRLGEGIYPRGGGGGQAPPEPLALQEADVGGEEDEGHLSLHLRPLLDGVHQQEVTWGGHRGVTWGGG